jgi:hypothetical protein
MSIHSSPDPRSPTSRCIERIEFVCRGTLTYPQNLASRVPLVVRTATAVTNPALRQVGYVLGGVGLHQAKSAQGGVTVCGDDGSVLADSGGAAMWDSSVDGVAAPATAGTTGAAPTGAGPALTEAAEPSSPRSPGERARTGRATVRLDGARLVVEPDPAMLATAERG